MRRGPIPLREAAIIVCFLFQDTELHNVNRKPTQLITNAPYTDNGNTSASSAMTTCCNPYKPPYQAEHI